MSALAGCVRSPMQNGFRVGGDLRASRPGGFLSEVPRIAFEVCEAEHLLEDSHAEGSAWNYVR